MNAKKDINRRVQVIQAKKKRHKANKKKGRTTTAPNGPVVASNATSGIAVTALSPVVENENFMFDPDGKNNSADDSIDNTTTTNATTTTTTTTSVAAAAATTKNANNILNSIQDINSAHCKEITYSTVNHHQGPQLQQPEIKSLDPSNSSSNETIGEHEDLYTSEDEEQENREDYCKGGYHPVKIGDLFLNRYHVTRKLGWGHFSTVSDLLTCLVLMPSIGALTTMKLNSTNKTTTISFHCRYGCAGIWKINAM